MKIKKLAVEPIHPAAAAAMAAVSTPAPVIPINWQSAFAVLARQVTAFVEHHAAQIQGLVDELADARGLIVAGNRTAGEHATRIKTLSDDLVALREQSDAAAGAATQHTNDTVAAAIDTLDKALTRRIDEVAEQAATVEHVNRAINAQGERINELAGTVAAVEKQSAGNAAAFDVQDGAVKAQGERINELAGTVAATETAVGELRKGVVDAGAKLLEQIDDVAGRVAAVVKGRAEDRAVIDTLGAGFEQVNEYAGECFNTAMKAITDESEDRAKAIGELAGNAAQFKADTLEASNKAFEALAELVLAVGTVEATSKRNAANYDKLDARAREIAEGVEDLAGNVQAMTKARAEDRTTLDELAGTVAAAGEVVGVLEDKLTETVKGQGETRLRLDEFAGTVAEVRVSVTALKAESETINQSVDRHMTDVRTIGEQASDAVRRVTLALEQMPAAMMIDRAGHLLRVNRAGEMTDLGKVIDHGRDGKDAPQLVAARIEGDRLIMTLTDRTEISCSVAGLKPADPAPAAPEIDPTTLGYLSKDAKMRAVQIEDMTKLRAANWTFATIGKKYKCSARTVARLIRGLDDDEASNA